MKYNTKYDFFVAVDSLSNVDYLETETFEFPTSGLKFEMLSDTDYLQIVDQ